MMPDTYTRTEQAAGEHAALLGRIEDLGAGGDDSVPVGGIPRLGPDPWLPWTCPKCGDDDRNGMPEICPDCGWRNYG